MEEFVVQVIADNDVKTKRVQLEAEKHSDIAQQKAKLLKVMELIDIYDQVIDSHVEAKTVFYKLSVQSAIERTKGQAFVQQTRNQLNRCMFNTLNLGKLYLDKNFFKEKSFIKKITESEEAHQKAENLRKKVFTENSEYMLGCELRAYSQHASIMTRTIHRGIQRDLEKSQLTANVSASISKRELCSKRHISEEKLLRIPDKIDLQKCLDGYVDGISEMHILNLNLLRDFVDALIKQIETFAQSLAHNVGANISDAYFIKVTCDTHSDENEQNTNEASVSISSEWLDLIRQLLDKHRSATKFLHTKHEPS
ncbi:hypothetical protein [Idiomarina sp. HP20-50]|uniref:hypothetical protein n=1 Tax=Idiomarina sp. HP20-50 TaxID=3070813 RepID=UPI00294B0125|nr:hypothetical protein [Idiomarina sp. HP20-50]MDV6317218.1 hypothetical protein [Idiomarina sp. HP20-50]